MLCVILGVVFSNFLFVLSSPGFFYDGSFHDCPRDGYVCELVHSLSWNDVVFSVLLVAVFFMGLMILGVSIFLFLNALRYQDDIDHDD